MKISVAKTAGFCMGVHRAVEMALDASNTYEKPIYTYGPLIHNPQVLQLLKEKGVSVLNEIPEKGSGTVLVRAHGVPPHARDRLRAAGFQVIDATCPRVIKVQRIIRKHARDGFHCIIVGDQDHPEVVGLLGYAGDKGHVVGTLDELATLPVFDKAIIVAQTTQNTDFFREVKTWAAENRSHYKVHETICDSTERRQEETRRMADFVDAVVVVGGHNSGNTRRLAELVRESGKTAVHVETKDELDAASLGSARRIGLTAGASTPNWIIKSVYQAIETFPLDGDKSWRYRVFQVQRFLLQTNLYTAVGAAFLCYSCTRLQMLRHSYPYMMISMLYVLSMHILNNLTGIKEARYNDPDRAAFYERNKIVLTLTAITCGGMGLITAANMGMTPFFILLIMSLLGLSYNLTLIPEFIDGFKYRRIRDIPGSKTILIALAWGVVTALFPCLALNGHLRWSTLTALVWSTGIVFARTAFFDILDMQGDRIVGKETLPLMVGERKSLLAIKVLLVALTGWFYFSYRFIPKVPDLALWLMVCPLFLLFLILFHRWGRLYSGVRLEFLIESQFILAGTVTLFWRFLG